MMEPTCALTGCGNHQARRLKKGEPMDGGSENFNVNGLSE
jgi:hypothetical protein